MPQRQGSLTQNIENVSVDNISFQVANNAVPKQNIL